MSASAQQHQRDRRPYTRTLSALLKTDLIRLATDFRLPTDGSVLDLRNRLRVYLNARRDNLRANPRYKALFPKNHRPVQPPHLTPPPPSTPALSYRSLSPVGSFDSWHGIGDQPQHHEHPLHHQPLVQPFVPLDPPPAVTPDPSDRSSPPPSIIAGDGRKSSCLNLFAQIYVCFHPYMGLGIISWS